jgi:hypothetical protein
MGSGGGGSAPAPDPQIGQAALANAQTGKDWLSFAKDAYATQTARQVPIDAIANASAQQALTTSQTQSQWATQAHDRYVNEYQPAQDSYLNTAENWDSAAKETEAAGAAKADVATNAASQMGANDRAMSAMGVNPASGRWAGVNRATDLSTAINEAGAETGARNNIKSQALNLQANAINMGNGLPAQSNASTGLGLNAGTSAENGLLGANQQMLGASSIMNQGFQGQMQGYANEGNMLQNQYNSQLQAYEFQQQQSAQQSASMMSGVGSILGMFMSSKKFKTGRKIATGSVEKIKAMPVQTYKYKTGIADGGAQQHIGPMAEDFQKATGTGNGQTISAQDAIGLTMGAVQELAGKVDAIHKAVGLGKAAIKKHDSKPRAMKKAA